jgi:protein-L-isoaspartate(D-aspartate) O-methyltransferase
MICFFIKRFFLTATLSIILLIMNPLSLYAQAERHTERDDMVRRQIAGRGIEDNATLSAMRRVPRHLFVPDNQRRRAYSDSPLPIGYGQTISQPYIVAFMTEIIEPKENHRILEIGTGSGYQAAVLAKIVAEVYTIEIVPELAVSAEKVIRDLDYDNVQVKAADGYHGWEEFAPFDAIVVTAASEHIPPPLINQLKEDGKMIIPVGSPYMVQNLMLVQKDGDRVMTESLMPVRFVPFTRD